MEREWTGNARRLSEADRVEIDRRIHDGETFAAVASAVGVLDEVDSEIPSGDWRYQTADGGRARRHDCR
jgi:hypothetical protein